MYLQFVHLDSAFHLVVEVFQIVKILKMLIPGNWAFLPVIRNIYITPTVLRPALKF